MKQVVNIGLAGCMMLLAGCGQEDTSTVTDTGGSMNGAVATSPMTVDNPIDNPAAGNSAMPDPATMSAQQFADMAAASDQFELQSAEFASQKATEDSLKRFARMMQRDHNQSTENLKLAASQADPVVTPAPQLTPEQQNNLEALRNAQGSAFNAAYRTQQVAAHEQALALMRGYAENGQDASLKTFARTTAPIIERHLAEIRGG